MRQPAVSGAFGGPIETWPTWRVNVFVQASGDRIWAPGSHGIWSWTWTSDYCEM